MKLRRPLLIKGLGLASAWFIRAWMNTLVIRRDEQARKHPADADRDYEVVEEAVPLGPELRDPCPRSQRCSGF